jgi:hypothetical protein
VITSYVTTPYIGRTIFFSSELIEDLEIRVAPTIFLIIHLLEAADDAAFDSSLSTSLNLMLLTRDFFISRVVPIGCEIHDMIL